MSHQKAPCKPKPSHSHDSIVPSVRASERNTEASGVAIGSLRNLKILNPWSVGGLSKSVISRRTSTLKGALIGVMILISLLNNIATH